MYINTCYTACYKQFLKCLYTAYILRKIKLSQLFYSIPHCELKLSDTVELTILLREFQYQCHYQHIFIMICIPNVWKIPYKIIRVLLNAVSYVLLLCNTNKLFTHVKQEPKKLI